MNVVEWMYIIWMWNEVCALRNCITCHEDMRVCARVYSVLSVAERAIAHRNKMCRKAETQKFSFCKLFATNEHKFWLFTQHRFSEVYGVSWLAGWLLRLNGMERNGWLSVCGMRVCCREMCIFVEKHSSIVWKFMVCEQWRWNSNNSNNNHSAVLPSLLPSLLLSLSSSSSHLLGSVAVMALVRRLGSAHLLVFFADFQSFAQSRSPYIS